MRRPAYVWHLILAATVSSLESAGSVCDTDAHGNGAESLWALMKFAVSVSTVDYPEHIPIVFGSYYACLRSTHHFSDLGFFFPITLTCKEAGPMIRKTLHQIFYLGQRKTFQYKASLEPTCFLWAFPNQRQRNLDNTKKGMPTPGCHGQNKGWEDGGFQPFRTALPAPSCTTQAESRAEPSHHWQIEGSGFIRISDLILYNKPLCSLANLVKRLLFKKKL